MKKIISIIFAVLMLVSCIPMSISAASTDSPVFVMARQNGEAVKITPTDNIFYLSAMVDITKVEICSSDGGKIYYADPAKTFSGSVNSGEALDLTKAQTVDERGVTCYKLKLTANKKASDYVFYADSDLPSVFVTTSKGLPYVESSKENRDKNSRILIMSGDGKVEYSDLTSAEGTKSEIKLRGNATAGYYKKPYQIKLGEKTSILGMDKAKTWILLANYTDQSALHNALAWEMGNALGLEYNIDYRFTNLYIDGKYMGLYTICEKVQVDSARVDIEDLEKAGEKANPDVELEDLGQTTVSSGTLISESILSSYKYTNGKKSPADITGGYLIELDNNYGKSEPSHFITENGNIYVVKSPEYASKEEVEYIASIFADMEEAIYSDTGYNKKGKHYSEYIDMKSFAGVYTVQELMKNWDAYTSSVFFYKDKDVDGVQSKIFCGPIWDLDNTLGNIDFDQNFGRDTAYLWAQHGNFGGYHRGFAKNLMEHEDFQKVTADCFDTLYTAVQGYLAEGGWLQQTSESIRAGVMMDRTRWKMYDANSWLLNRYGMKSSVKFVQFVEYGRYDDDATNTALGFLRYYLSTRAEMLKKSIGTVGIDEPTQEKAPLATTVPYVSTTPTQTTATKATTQKTNITTVSTSAVTTGTSASSPVTSPAEPNTATVWYVILGAAALSVCMIILVTVKKKK